MPQNETGRIGEAGREVSAPVVLNVGDVMYDALLFYRQKIKTHSTVIQKEKLEGKHGIFEFKERDSEKFYRIFAFWDSDTDTKTLILGTHGFDKKTNKTPISEIDRAANIKKAYFHSKNNKK